MFEDSANSQQLKDRKGSFPQTNHVPPFGIRNELRVLIEYAKLCHSKLDEYSHTVQGDRELLARGDLTQNQRNIVTITLEEKLQLTTLL